MLRLTIIECLRFSTPVGLTSVKKTLKPMNVIQHKANQSTMKSGLDKKTKNVRKTHVFTFSFAGFCVCWIGLGV